MDFLEDEPIFVKIKRNKKRWWFRKGNVYMVKDYGMWERKQCFEVMAGAFQGSLIPKYCCEIITQEKAETSPEFMAGFVIQNIQDGLKSEEPFHQKASLLLAFFIKRAVSSDAGSR